MSFTDRQLRALGRQVPVRNIRSRMSGGRELSYIEGWYAITEANRIFGFDGWDRETVEVKCLQARETRGTWSAVYSARVRIKVRAAEAEIIRDGHGTGEACASSLGEVHDRALKAAETDATKRALATFGKAFGLALYGGARLSPRPGPNGLRSNEAAPQIATGDVSLIVATADQAAYAADRTALRIDPPPPSTPGVTAGSHRVDKSALAFPEPARIRDKEHLRFVAAQPCLLCGATPSDAHHVRYAQRRAMSRKVSDEFAVPLCRGHHRELHKEGNEAAWWHDMGIDPLDVARRLWEESNSQATSLGGLASPPPEPGSTVDA